MRNQKGNIVIILIIGLLVCAFYYLATLKYKTIKENEKNAEKTAELEKLQSSLASGNKPAHFPSPTTNIATAQQPAVVLGPDEVLNPFDSTVARSVQTSQQVLSTNAKAAASNDVAAINGIVESPNLILIAPNGKELPIGTGYLPDYPINNMDGSLNIKINNTHGKSNLLVFLYHLRPYDSKPSDTRKTISRAIYVQGGHEFNLEQMQSGHYQLEWVDLSTKKAYRNKPFMIYQDNKYAYDRVFNFSNKIENQSVTNISLQSFGYR